MNPTDERPPTKISAVTVFDMLTAEYQAEVTSLAELAHSDMPEASRLFGRLITHTRSLSEEDAAARIAKGLRDHFGLADDDSVLVTELTPENSDRFDAVCAELLRGE